MQAMAPFERSVVGNRAIESMAAGVDVRGTTAGRVHTCTTAQPDGAMGAIA